MFKRNLMLDLPPRQSAFLWGARKTGKSLFLKSNFKNSIYYDLLDTHELIRLSRSPYLLREEVIADTTERSAYPIIIDEIQKIPELLNEVHWLIENTHCQFILCSSSARKLKTSATNLLGGRAWKYHFYPLTFSEIPKLNLLQALQHGLIPNHYLSESKHLQEHLQAYVDIYLTDEIRNEGLVRNLPGFARFLEVVGICNGEMINAANIARDCGVNRVTVQDYYQILVDTLLGYFIYPYRKKIKRDIIITMPKFYLFDVGIANYLGKNFVTALQGHVAGRSLEHYILMELIAFRGLSRKQFDVTYWRTKTGLETDFILGKAEIAIEVKINEQVHRQDLKGLIAFCEEHPKVTAIVVSQDKKKRTLKINEKTAISILPWEVFLKTLWKGEII